MSMVDSSPDPDSVAGSRIRPLVRASWIGIVGNAILAVIKLIVGVTARSVAVVSDGVDSAMDVMTSIILLVASRITEKPPDLDHPYGHARAETIATKTLSFVIFFAGAQLAVASVTALIRGTPAEPPGTGALLVTTISIAAKTALYIHKLVVGRRTSSSMLLADAKNMRGDIAVSIAVLLSLLFIDVLDAPILDLITSIAISLWIMYVGLQIFFETNFELMEGFRETRLYRDIFDAVEKVPGAYHPHRARIREMGNKRIVDLDIEVDGGLTVQEAHEIAKDAETAIRQCLEDVYDVLVHVEPRGNVEDAEKYGVSRKKLPGDRV